MLMSDLPLKHSQCVTAEVDSSYETLGNSITKQNLNKGRNIVLVHLK